MTYRIEEADRAEADREAAFLRIARRAPAYAGRWQEGLLRAITALASFPGPRAHPVAPESEQLGVEVRRLLHYGPGRRSGAVYRVLFQVIDPVEGETEGTIRVPRILHGAQQPLGEAEPDENGVH